MNLNAPVSSIMTAQPITLAPMDKLKKVKEIFESNSIHHIPVVDDDKLVGMISKSDYLYFIRPLHKESKESYINEIRLKNYTVQEAMAKFIVTVSPSDTIQSAVELLTENLFHALPVI